LRNYQTLTLIGSILGILIAFGVMATIGVLDITMTSFENFTSDTPDQLQQQKQERSSDMQYIYSSGSIAVVLYIIALIIAFVIKERTKIVGIVLLVIAVATLILIGFFGVIGFALLLTAGIVALRYKKVAVSFSE
jgi:hypothetical protein